MERDAGSSALLRGDEQAAFDLALQNLANCARDVIKGNDLRHLVQIVRFQIRGQALPDILPVGHGARHGVNAQQVDTAEQKWNDRPVKVVAAHQATKRDVTGEIRGPQQITQRRAPDRIHRPGPSGLE